MCTNGRRILPYGNIVQLFPVSVNAIGVQYYFGWQTEAGQASDLAFISEIIRKLVFVQSQGFIGLHGVIYLSRIHIHPHYEWEMK